MTQTAPVQPADTLAAIAAVARNLEAELARLSPKEWDRPSACDDWTAGDVIGHITWAGEYFARLIDRGLAGDTAQPANLPPHGPARRRAIADGGRRARAEFGDDLIDAFRRANQTLTEALGRVEPDDWDRPTTHRVGSIRRLAQVRVNELTVHGWDIRSPIDPPGHLDPAGLPVLIDLLAAWYPLMATPDASDPVLHRLRFDVTNPDLGEHDLVIGPETVSFSPAAGEPAHLTLRGPAEAIVLLALARIDVATARAEYGLRPVAGEEKLATLLQTRFGVA